MKLLFAPPYLENGLRAALDACPSAAAPLRAGDLLVASELQADVPARISRAAVVVAAPEAVWAWRLSLAPAAKGEALLAASRVLASAANVAQLPGALVVEEAELRADPAAVLRRILGHLCGGAPTVPAQAAIPVVQALRAAFAPPEIAALDLYRHLPLPADAATWWPAELFHSTEPAFPGAIDITGPARVLTYGPYVCLGPGLWEAEIMLEVCPDAAQYDYPIDFGVLGDFSQCVARPSGGGRQTVTLAHAFGAVAPAELRIWLGRAAFHGELRLHGVKLSRLAGEAAALDRSVA